MTDIKKIREQLKERIDNADMETLEMINDFFEYGNDDPLMNMTPEQEASFLRGLKDADEGRVIPHEEVMKEFRKWHAK
jgi:hypothetical protein